MSKEFKNIDDLFKSTLGTGTAQAPKVVKAKVMSATGGGNLWMIGAILLLATAISAITVTLNMPENNQTVKTDETVKPELFIQNQANDSKQPSQTNEELATNNQQALSDNMADHDVIENSENRTENETTQIVTSKKLNTLNKEKTEKSIQPKQTISKRAKTKSPTKKSMMVQKSAKNNLIKVDEAKALQKSMEKTNELARNEDSPIQSPNIEHTEKAKNNNTEKTIDNTSEQAEIMGVEEPLKTAPSTDEKSSKAIAETKVQSQKDILEQTTPSVNTNEAIATVETKDQEVKTAENTIIEATEAAIEATESPAVEPTSIASNETSDSSETETSAIEIESEPKLKKGYWTAGAHIAPNINRANYGNTPFGDSLAKYNTEKLGFQTQFNAQYTFGSNFSLGLGVGYESQNFITTTNIINYSYDIETSFIDEFVIDNISGDTLGTISIPQYDTLGVSPSGVASSSGNSRLQYFQIPIRLGYEIELNKWLLGAHLGVQVNYLYKGMGQFVKNNEVNDFNDMNILKRTTLNYQIGANVKYNIINNLYLTGQLIFTPALQNYYNESFGTRSLTSTSLGIGAAIKF